MEILKNRKTLVAVALAAGLAVGTWVGGGVLSASAAQQQPAAKDATPLAVPPSPAQLSTSFSKLAKQLEPSVVQVTSVIDERPQQGRGRRPQTPDDDGSDLFRRFFGGDPFGDLPRVPRRAQGTGSGFIVDRNGYILTNNHVVDGATRVRVTLHDDSADYTAKVIGVDPELDLAVIKIDANRELAPVRIGNSDGVEVGDWAVAIGSPFGLDATVTAGIISAKGRALNDPDHQIQRFIQTDAAINPGNSGGPLLNINGEVIGVNTMIATSTGAFAGVGFALPINLAVNSYNQIIKTGKVSRGAIGILFDRNQKPELLKAYGGGDGGVFVTQVTPNTPADRAGIREGDIITSFNGKKVKDGEELVAQVSQTPVGARAPVTLLRDGKKIEVNLEVGDRAAIVGRNAGQAGPGDPEGGDEAGKQVKFGLSVRNLTANERQNLGVAETGGVLVTEIEEGSFADDLNLRENDIITAVNRQPVNSTEDLRRIAGTVKPGDAVAFKALRALPQPGGRRGGWQTFFAAGTLPAQNQ